MRREHLSTCLATLMLAASACLFGIACGGRSSAVQPPGIPTLYGDGSAGNKVVAADAHVDRSQSAERELQVNAGVTLTVCRGTVIKCTGAFTNNGTIDVPWTLAPSLPSRRLPSPTADVPRNPGNSYAPPANGEFGTNAGSRIGRDGGVGMDESTRFIRIVGHARADPVHVLVGLNLGGAGRGGPRS